MLLALVMLCGGMANSFGYNCFSLAGYPGIQWNALGLAVEPQSGHIFLSALSYGGEDNLYEFDSAGHLLRSARVSGEGSLGAIAVGPDGHLFVATTGSTILELSPDGQTLFSCLPNLEAFWGMCYDPGAEQLLLNDFAAETLSEVSTTGEPISQQHLASGCYCGMAYDAVNGKLYLNRTAPAILDEYGRNELGQFVYEKSYSLGSLPGLRTALALGYNGANNQFYLQDDNARVIIFGLDELAPCPAIGGMSLLSGTNLWLQVLGSPAVTYMLQASTNLQDWVEVQTFTQGPDGFWELLAQDPHQYPSRYYRVRQESSADTIEMSAVSGAIEFPFVSADDSIYQAWPTDLADAGRAVYTFTVPRAGDFLLRAMVNAPDSGGNSFYVNMDAEPEDPFMIWDIQPFTAGFESRVVTWRGNGTDTNNQFTPKVFSLTQGEHRLIIRGAAPGTLLHSLTVSPCTSIYLPAVSGTVTAPFVVTNGYLYQPVQTGVMDGGRAAYNVFLPRTGPYVIRAVVDAVEGSSNSFYVNVDAEPLASCMLWEIPPTTGFMPWTVGWRGGASDVSSEFIPRVFELKRGMHQIVIRGAAAGTRLESLTIVDYQ